MDNYSPSSPMASEPQLHFGKIDDLSSRVAASIDAARKRLFSQQHEGGYWCGELEADTTLESDYILLHTLLGTGDQNGLRRPLITFCSIRTMMEGGASTLPALRMSALR